MKYFLYQLVFDTPIHFGSTEEGGKLEQSDMTYRSDTLFSALCCELAAMNDENGITRLYQAVQKGQFVFSDLFPYKNMAGDYAFYLPKPILIVSRAETAPSKYETFRTQATLQKKQKKLQYIRVSQLEEYIHSLSSGKLKQWDVPYFGQSDLVTRVNCLDNVPLPYYVNQFTFAADAGLYGIVGYEQEEDQEWFCQVLQEVGLTGIGGKRSSGYGKFHFLDDPIFMDEQEGVYDDDRQLYRLLTEQKTDQYMNISVLLPNKDDISIVKKGQYKLCKRSGFLSPDGTTVKKKNDVYMIASGSCFPIRMQGEIATLSDATNHPVWRYGKGLYVGLMV